MVASPSGGPDDIAQGGVFYNDWQMSLTNVSVANTTKRADDDEIIGGVVANEVYDCCPSDGVLSIDGLTVSGTSNGADGVDTEVGGGILFNDWKASVNGLNVSSTTNNAGGDEVFGGVGDTDFLQDVTEDCSGCPPNLDGGTSSKTSTSAAPRTTHPVTATSRVASSPSTTISTPMHL